MDETKATAVRDDRPVGCGVPTGPDHLPELEKSMNAESRRVLTFVLCLLLAGGALLAQSSKVIVKRSENRPLESFSAAGEAALALAPKVGRGLREIPNFRGAPESPPGSVEGPDPLLQDAPSIDATSVISSFEATDNEDNLAVIGFRVAPPDTDGDVGPSHFVQMINLLTTIFDHNGNVVPGGGPFPTNAIWSGAGGLCEQFNQGDPFVVYDEANDRWVVTQFAFDDNFTTFAQCVAVSQSGNPTGGYNRYEFSFNGIGFPDYPKHGVVTESITMTANIFAPPVFNFTGTFVGAMDKAAMYAGQAATLVGTNLGASEFGFLPADLDDPSGTASFTPALFATAMSRTRRFDIWQIDVDWNNPGAGTVGRIAGLSIARFDADLCSASREACITQCNNGPGLEALSDRLMARLKIRDFGSHKSMVAAHTVDVGGGRGGIRWYETRQAPNGNWSLHQQATYGPNDGINRWVPSIAINAAGDIGIGYLVSGPSLCMGSRLNGQTAGASGSGNLDAGEQTCRVGVTQQTGTARAGDYSATNVDPVTDSFWHTNEYGQRNDKSAGWGTTFCEFDVGGGGCVPTENPEMSCNDGQDNDCDGLTDGADPDCQGGGCFPNGASCSVDSDCCSGNCSNGPPASRVCQ